MSPIKERFDNHEQRSEIKESRIVTQSPGWDAAQPASVVVDLDDNRTINFQGVSISPERKKAGLCTFLRFKPGIICMIQGDDVEFVDSKEGITFSLETLEPVSSKKKAPKWLRRLRECFLSDKPATRPSTETVEQSLEVNEGVIIHAVDGVIVGSTSLNETEPKGDGVEVESGQHWGVLTPRDGLPGDSFLLFDFVQTPPEIREENDSTTTVDFGAQGSATITNGYGELNLTSPRLEDIFLLHFTQ